ncbi:hypothetical protein E2C01_057868 [Portunus trituberculatus]|uniref:Uncharacterized protein n=1 Tax=Portunus trituberculatus TaxID=210409 RepID=A0A5B7H2A0_PORTR|nr:hypothetical protein [Portunus trituberculatus]
MVCEQFLKTGVQEAPREADKLRLPAPRHPSTHIHVFYTLDTQKPPQPHLDTEEMSKTNSALSKQSGNYNPWRRNRGSTSTPPNHKHTTRVSRPPSYRDPDTA